MNTKITNTPSERKENNKPRNLQALGSCEINIQELNEKKGISYWCTPYKRENEEGENKNDNSNRQLESKPTSIATTEYKFFQSPINQPRLQPALEVKHDPTTGTDSVGKDKDYSVLSDVQSSGPPCPYSPRDMKPRPS